MCGPVITSATASLEGRQPLISHEPHLNLHIQAEPAAFSTDHAGAAPFWPSLVEEEAQQQLIWIINKCCVIDEAVSAGYGLFCLSINSNGRTCH